jgi:hypothetical protein
MPSVALDRERQSALELDAKYRLRHRTDTAIIRLCSLIRPESLIVLRQASRPKQKQPALPRGLSTELPSRPAE